MIVARINDYKIEEKEYLAELNKVVKDSNLEHPDRALRKKALNNLINGALVLQKAHKENIQVTDDDVQQEMIKLQLKFDSPEEFQEMLSCTGCTEEELVQRIRDKLIVRKYLERCVSQGLEIDEDYLYQFYKKYISLFENEEMVRVSHILTPLEKGLPSAQELREQIGGPADFYNMAERCSECPSCCKAGDLGYIIRGKMIKEFDRVAFHLAVKEISQPVRTEHGYHIIMVTDRREAGVLSFDEVKEPLKKRLKQIDYELKVDKHLAELREKADIKIDRDYFTAENTEGAQ